MRLNSVDKIILKSYVVCTEYIWASSYGPDVNIAHDKITTITTNFLGFHVALINDVIMDYET